MQQNKQQWEGDDRNATKHKQQWKGDYGNAFAIKLARNNQYRTSFRRNFDIQNTKQKLQTTNEMNN